MHLRPQNGTRVACPGPSGAPVEVTYLRTAGVLFRRGTRDVVMTAPFYSNPSLFAVGLGRPIAADDELIRRHLPWVGDAKAILVGHAHYDHLMDVPEIAWKHAPLATVYGNATAVNLLTPVLPAERLRAVEDERGTQETPGKWITVPGTRVRFMPLVSEHAPHVAGITFFTGSVETPRTAGTACGWKEGQTLAYLIDFLSEDGSRVEYRVYYRDSAGNEPFGAPPPLPPQDQHAIDLAVLCVASFHQVHDYPEWMLRVLQPRHVLLAHWESFFRSPDRSLAPIPLLNTRRFVRRLGTDVPWTTLLPGATMTCRPGTTLH